MNYNYISYDGLITTCELLLHSKFINQCVPVPTCLFFFLGTSQYLYNDNKASNSAFIANAQCVYPRHRHKPSYTLETHQLPVLAFHSGWIGELMLVGLLLFCPYCIHWIIVLDIYVTHVISSNLVLTLLNSFKFYLAWKCTVCGKVDQMYTILC